MDKVLHHSYNASVHFNFLLNFPCSTNLFFFKSCYTIIFSRRCVWCRLMTWGMILARKKHLNKGIKQMFSLGFFTSHINQNKKYLKKLFIIIITFGKKKKNLSSTQKKKPKIYGFCQIQRSKIQVFILLHPTAALKMYHLC